jgi:hypothetical protein
VRQSGSALGEFIAQCGDAPLDNGGVADLAAETSLRISPDGSSTEKNPVIVPAGLRQATQRLMRGALTPSSPVRMFADCGNDRRHSEGLLLQGEIDPAW